PAPFSALTPSASQSAAADPLALWRDFPADRKPRPIVLIGSPFLEAGYHTGDAKMAAGQGAFELAVPMPSVPPATLPLTLPDGPAALPTISAEQALSAIRAQSAPHKQADEPSAAPLRITGVRLETAKFHTDRGPWELPAWRFA